MAGLCRLSGTAFSPRGPQQVMLCQQIGRALDDRKRQLCPLRDIGSDCSPSDRLRIHSIAMFAAAESLSPSDGTVEPRLPSCGSPFDTIL